MLVISASEASSSPRIKNNNQARTFGECGGTCTTAVLNVIHMYTSHTRDATPPSNTAVTAVTTNHFHSSVEAYSSCDTCALLVFVRFRPVVEIGVGTQAAQRTDAPGGWWMVDYHLPFQAATLQLYVLMCPVPGM